MKYFRYLINIIKSFGYDFVYYLIGNLPYRASAATYRKYIASRLYAGHLKQGNAAEHILPLALKHCKGKGVDIGASVWPFPGAKPIEDNPDENAFCILEDEASLDYIFSSHLLEHIQDHSRALHHWHSKLKTGGILFMYLPHPSCEMWKKKNLIYHIWNPSPNTLEEELIEIGFSIKDISYAPDGYQSFYVIAEKQGVAII